MIPGVDELGKAHCIEGPYLYKVLAHKLLTFQMAGHTTKEWVRLFADTANSILRQIEQGKMDDIFRDNEEKSDGSANYGQNEPHLEGLNLVS